MDSRYYELLRNASQEDFYEAVNSPEHELYDVVWDLFETVVIEPAEAFDSEFGNRNQFRYSISSSLTLEFFPDSAYFERRYEPNPYRDGSDAAGVHLKFSILPGMSCLFSVGLQIWGRAERLAFRKLWKDHRELVKDLLVRAKPMVEKRIPSPAMEHAPTLEGMLDSYFTVRDAENFIEFRYPFAQFDESEAAQNFMVYMSLLYQAIRNYCQYRDHRLEQLVDLLNDFYSGHLPELPLPLPCVEMVLTSDPD